MNFPVFSDKLSDFTDKKAIHFPFDGIGVDIFPDSFVILIASYDVIMKGSLKHRFACRAEMVVYAFGGCILEPPNHASYPSCIW